MNLLLAGFNVAIGAGIDKKDQTTVASNALGLLERPLDRAWLERVWKLSNSASLQSVPASNRISTDDFERLLASPQFSFSSVREYTEERMRREDENAIPNCA